MSIGKDDVILVTGATGFTGKHLVRALCKTGASIRVIVRDTSDTSEIDDLPLTKFTGDVFDPSVVDKAMSGVTYVFHVAAAYREAKINDEVYWNVHVKSTHHLAEAAVKQPGFRRFVHVSTMGVHGHIDEPPATEEYRFSPGDKYQETKVEAELWIREFAKENDLPLCVVRPAAIYGPGDKRLLKVFKMAQMRFVPMLGFGQKFLYHLIHVTDLVRFMMVAAVHERTLGEVYVCGAQEYISIPDMIKIIADKLGTKPKFIKLPVTPFFIAGDLCELICKPLNIEPPIYRRRVAFFTKDRAFDTSKLRQHTQFEYSFTNETGLHNVLDWYLEAGWLSK